MHLSRIIRWDMIAKLLKMFCGRFIAFSSSLNTKYMASICLFNIKTYDIIIQDRTLTCVIGKEFK